MGSGSSGIRGAARSTARRRFCAFAAAGAAALGAGAQSAQSAEAAPHWLDPVTVAPPSTGVYDIAAGVDGSGRVIAAIARNDGASESPYVIDLATQLPGEQFSSATLQRGSSVVGDVEVAVNGEGRAVVVWARYNGEVWAAAAPPSGGFGAPQLLSGSGASMPEVAINDAGAAIAVWRQYNSASNPYAVQASFKSPSGSFGAAQTISSAELWSNDPDVVLDSTGKATIAWSHWTNTSGDANFARARVRAADGGLGTQRNISAGAPTGYPIVPVLALQSSGDVVAVFARWVAASSTYEATGAVRAAGADTWTALPALGPASANYTDGPRAAADAEGATTAVWRSPNNTLAAARRLSGGSFGTPQTGISLATASDSRVAVSPGGMAIAVWRRGTDATVLGEASIRTTPGGSFGAVQTLPATAGVERIEVVADRLDNATVIWSEYDWSQPAASRALVRAVRYETTPPRLPTTLAAGWRAGKRATTVSKLTLKTIRAGSKAKVVCAGKGCPFKAKTVSFPAGKAGHSLAGLFGKAQLKPRAKVTVSVSDPAWIGTWWEYTMRSSKAPAARTGCLAPGGGSRIACP